MNRRSLTCLGAAAVCAGVLAFGGLRATAAAGGAVKTAWGDPDLQGLWAQKYQTPLQRAARDAGKPTLTPEEVKQREASRAQQAADAPKRGDRIAPRGTLEDLTGAYDTTFEADPIDTSRPIGPRTSLIIDPPDGRIPALTPAVQQRMRDMREFMLALMQSVDACKRSQDIACFGVTPGPVSPRRNEPPPHYLAAQIMGDRVINRANGPEDFGLGERCLAGTLPSFGVQQIVQSPGAVSILYEGWQRVIPITQAPHIPANVRQWHGDSRGRWEGNTLVIDVTNFTPKTDYQGARENLHLVERFTRIDANTLEYVVTLDDNTTWERPWTVKVEMALQDRKANAIYDEPRCHDGNIALKDMLIGARMDDKAFAEGRGPDPATMCYLLCGTGNPEYARQRQEGRSGGAAVSAEKTGAGPNGRTNGKRR
jgi:hypothetical protein